MKLSAKARYAVTAMLEVARGKKDVVSLTSISLKQNLSVNFLEQIFYKLRRSNLVVSTRGAQGGYRLAKKPQEISIYSVVTSVDEPVKSVRCVSGVGCQPNGARCLTHELWHNLDETIKLYLQSITLHDVCSLKKVPFVSAILEKKELLQKDIKR